MARKIHAVVITADGQTERYMTEAPLRYDDSLREENLGGRRLNLARITSIRTEYTAPIPYDKADAFWMAAAGGAAFGVVGAAVGAALSASTTAGTACYCWIVSSDYDPNREIRLIADAPVVERILSIIQETNYFGGREEQKESLFERGVTRLGDLIVAAVWIFLALIFLLAGILWVLSKIF